jgi:hypothetical protein
MTTDARIERVGSSLIVALNESQPEVRRRFSLAHEIAHVLLGHMGTEVGQVEYRGAVRGLKPGSATQEDEALCNALAAYLLLPTAIILPRFNGAMDVFRVASIARAANVSLHATMRRIVSLATSPIVAVICRSSQWQTRGVTWWDTSAGASRRGIAKDLGDPAFVEFILENSNHRIDGESVSWVRSSSISKSHRGFKYEFVIAHVEVH